MTIENLSELQLYINLLQVQYNRILNDYEEIIKLLKLEFNIDCKIEDLNALYEPTVEEDVIDLELLYKNIW
jgi:hypothetical protein